MKEPRYLGDGVYVQLHPNDSSTILLTTGSHLLNQAIDTIELEPEVLTALLEWLKPE